MFTYISYLFSMFSSKTSVNEFSTVIDDGQRIFVCCLSVFDCFSPKEENYYIFQALRLKQNV